MYIFASFDTILTGLIKIDTILTVSVHFQKILRNENESFSFQLEMGLDLHQQLHCHKECELIYIIKGSGTLLINNKVSTFRTNDIFFIGSNVPHMLRYDKLYVSAIPNGKVATIHLLPERLKSFADIPENRMLANLFGKESYAMISEKGGILELKTIIDSIRLARNTERLIYLLQLLNIIASSDRSETCSQNNFRLPVKKWDDNRLNRIYHYTLNNFSKEITIKEVADIVHLCSNSFCRYFKSRTKRRYSSFLIEVRINHACKLLLETEYSVSVVSYESGYMNLSNFNRHFKILKGKTPLEYRKQFSLCRDEATS